MNYYKIQNKFRESATDKIFTQKKFISDSETAIFQFSRKDSLLLDVNFNNEKGYSDIQFEELKNEYVEKFIPTKIKKWENFFVYYDEKSNIMIVKYFVDRTQKTLTSISFLTFNETIKGFLPIFENTDY